MHHRSFRAPFAPLICTLLLGISTPAFAQGAAEADDGDELHGYDIVSTARGFSRHRPSWVHPVSYSPDIRGNRTEAVFQISAKQRLFGTDLFFGYTQKSFWQAYDRASSSPFRETNYNPELFYRWSPQRLKFHGFGLDLGLDHESNGRSHPESRSWNRVFATAFLPKNNELYMLKLWWRVPEEPKSGPDDPRGDDNPDILDYYGYGEFDYRRQFGAHKQMLHLKLRANPASGRGALQVNWSVPAQNNYTFWMVQLFHGYGDSLIDHDREITRIGIGLMLAR